MNKKTATAPQLATEMFTGSDGVPVQITHGSGNVFADLDLPDAEELQIKSGLIIEVMETIRARGLTQAAAARLTGVSQPRISQMMNGKFDSITIDLLFKMLNRLGRHVEVQVSSQDTRPARTLLVA